VTPDLLASPVLWMAAGAMLAGVVVVLVALAGAVVSHLWRRGRITTRAAALPDTAGTAGWELDG
jgi:hypothetical protein